MTAPHKKPPRRIASGDGRPGVRVRVEDVETPGEPGRESK